MAPPFDAADAMPPCIASDSGAPVTLVTGQSPQALVLDDLYVYWENATGSVVEWPLSGCPATTLPTVLATNASAVSKLEELAVGDDYVYFGDTSGNLDTCARGGCAGSPSVFWKGVKYTDGPFPSLVANSKDIYYADVEGNFRASKLGPFAGWSSYVLEDVGASTMALSASDFYVVEGGEPPQIVGSAAKCSSMGCGGSKNHIVCTSTLLSNVPAMVVAGDYVYFTTHGDPTSIYQCPSRGGGSPSVYATDVAPYGLATDGTSLYWTNYIASGTVASCALGTTCSAPSTIASAQDQPLAIAVNSKNVYWTTATAVYEAPK